MPGCAVCVWVKPPDGWKSRTNTHRNPERNNESPFAVLPNWWAWRWACWLIPREIWLSVCVRDKPGSIHLHWCTFIERLDVWTMNRFWMHERSTHVHTHQCCVWNHLSVPMHDGPHLCVSLTCWCAALPHAKYASGQFIPMKICHVLRLPMLRHNVPLCITCHSSKPCCNGDFVACTLKIRPWRHTLTDQTHLNSVSVTSTQVS